MLFLAALVVPTLCCSDPKGASTGPNPVVVAEQSVEGRINGQPWQFGSGLIDIEVIEDDIHYVYLFPSENARCDEPPFDQPHLILHVPKMPGEYALGPVLNVTFAFQRDDEPRYEMTFDGALVVAEYTPERLVGAVYARRGQTHEVSGVFSARDCSEPSSGGSDESGGASAGGKVSPEQGMSANAGGFEPVGGLGEADDSIPESDMENEPIGGRSTGDSP